MSHPRIAAVTCMRNEGQFALEWVAYHREIGFDEILVFTNDCEDGLDTMLDHLAERGELTHIRNGPLDDLSPQLRAIARALAHPRVRGCDWLLFSDADEFPVISYGTGRIHDLVAAMPGHTDCIALHWKAFGTSGLASFPTDANVLEVNRQAQAEPDPTGFHKSLFRPNKFATATDHMPKKPFGPVVLRNARGQEMNPRALRGDFAKLRGNPPELFTFEGAAMHHYALRADDVFVMKNHRGDGRGFTNSKYFLNSGFYRRFNRNDVEDLGIQHHVPGMRTRKAAYLNDPDIAAAHQRGIAFFQDLKAQVLTPEQKTAWTKPAKDQGDTHGIL